MRASARLAVSRVVTPDGAMRSRITGLRSDGPMSLRPTLLGADVLLRPWDLEGAVQVCRAAGAAGPLAGDDLRLEVDVGPNSSLVLRDVAASLVLPGPAGACSSMIATVKVAAGATLVWLAEPVIAARGCNHRIRTTIALSLGSRLLLREQLLLGRHGERPGDLRQRLRVCVQDRPLYDQELVLGADAQAWDGPAVTGGRRALGSLLVVDPRWKTTGAVPAARAGDDVALLPLAGTAVLVTAIADDALGLRRLLDAEFLGLDPEDGLDAVSARQ